jgi:hypothetical protein
MDAEEARIILSETTPLLLRAAARLEESLQCCAPLIPADAAAYDALDGVALMQLDALGVRYARCQEMVGKTLRCIAIIVGAPASPFQVMLDGLRREGLVLPVRAWEETRALRSITGHAYLSKIDDFVKHYQEAARLGPLVVDTARQTNAFAEGLPHAA